MTPDWQARGGWFVVAQFALLALVFLSPDLSPRVFVPVLLTWTVTLLGWALLVWAALSLGRNLTPLPQPRDDAKLVTTGAFAFVRHPIYSAIVLIALGGALGRGSPLALAFTVALVTLLEFKSRREERLLLTRFPEYAAYSTRVKKFVPGVY